MQIDAVQAADGDAEDELREAEGGEDEIFDAHCGAVVETHRVRAGDAVVC